MRRAIVWAVAGAVALVTAAPPVHAHVAASVDDNNRYVKVQPLGDRVRVAYTVFFGERPGAQMRPQIDGDHDGVISEAEAGAFADNLGKEIAANLSVTLDGAVVPIAWAEVNVGMGAPSVAAGTFSVDLVAWVCATRGTHALSLRDHFRVLRPGETEVIVEDSPGVAIERARVGAVEDPRNDFRFTGAGGPLADDGLALRYTASDRAPVAPDVACAGAPREADGHLLLAVLIGGGVAIAAFVAWRLVRRR